MLRRITSTLVVLALAVVGFAAVGASPALAANSTCSTATTNWATGADPGTVDATTFWSFQCGGANNEDYSLAMEIQKKDVSGNWNPIQCGNVGGICHHNEPTSGWFNGGSPHSSEEIWNFYLQQCSQNLRFHVTVLFRGPSPDKNYNSSTRSTPSC